MPNIYVFWKSAADPPAPWTRLTRQGKYVRFTDSFNNHLGTTGDTTHNHGSMSSFTCGTGAPSYNSNAWANSMVPHTHPQPSWSIGSASNNPPYYGLDLIYTDLTNWEANERRFPAGAVIMSSQVLAEDAYLARFTAADGKFILNTSPGATGGSSSSHNHNCQGTTGSATGAGVAQGGSIINSGREQSHTHTVNLNSDSKYTEPRKLVTRLYAALALTLSAQVGTVVFCSGTPGDNWEVLAGWKDANLVPGNSDPTLSGSDTHDQSIAGNSSAFTSSSYTYYSGLVSVYALCVTHNHTIAATLSTVSHVPQSILLIPIKLKAELSPPMSLASSAHAQLIGLPW